MKVEWPEAADELPMVDVYLPMMKAAAIISAGELGVFEALAEGPLSLPALAQATKASEGGLRHLTDFLIAVGYLEGTPAGVANAPRASRWFTGKGHVNYTAGLLWTAQSWGLMGQLTASVRRGEPHQTLWDSMKAQPTWGPLFSSYMQAFARHLGPDLIKHVHLPDGAHRMLDLGGSHGLHSIAFCREYPQLSSVIVDFPSALTHTATTIAQAGLTERIRLAPGNVRDGQWGHGYDAVLYLSVAHNQTAEDNQTVLREVGGAMRSGGTLIIHEYLTGTPLDVYDAAFRLTLLVETATRTYSFEEISRWLGDSGFDAPQRIDLEPREKGTLLIARKR